MIIVNLLIFFIISGNAAAKTWSFEAQTTKVTLGNHGSVWLGSTNGLHQYRSGRWTHLTKAAEERSLNRITALAEDPATGVLWVGKSGAYGQGIERRFRNKWLNERLSTQNGKLPGNYISSICPNPDGMLVTSIKDLGGIGSALDIGNNATSSNLLLNQSSSACFCKETHCWVGTTSNGIFKFQEGHATPLLIIKGHEWGGISWVGNYLGTFDNRYVQTLLEDNHERLWIGLKASLGAQTGGLVMYDLRTEKASTQPITLPVSNDVRVILMDSSGFLWIGTGAGLVHFNPNNSEVVSLDTGYGPVNDLAYDKAHQTLWIAHGNQLSSMTLPLGG